jgi:hypothetical protein
LALRLLGVWAAIDGIDQWATVANTEFGFCSPRSTQLAAFLLHGAVKIVIAYVLLRGASLISAYFYSSRSSAPSNDGGETI